MFRTIVVRNLATLVEAVYVNDLSVEENVRNAYFQMERRNFNTWGYDTASHPPIEPGSVTVACGDWCAYVDGHRFQSVAINVPASTIERGA